MKKKQSSQQKPIGPQRSFELVEDRTKRINLKCKRKRNLIKKAIELQKLSDLDICIVIRDREMDKIMQYASGTKDAGLFEVNVAQELIESLEEDDKRYSMYDNDSYQEFIRRPRNKKSETQ